MINLLRNVNAVLFVLCFVLITVFLFKTSAKDYLRSWIDLSGVIFGATVTSLGILLSIAAGKETEFLDKLWPWLQEISRNLGVLVAFLVMGLVVAAFFAYQHIFFRHVEFIAENELRLSLVDRPGHVREIGLLEPNKTRDLRLRIGSRRIIGQNPINSNVLVSKRVDVMPLWTSWAKNKVQLTIIEDKFEPTPHSDSESD